jgi:hypothetical protein
MCRADARRSFPMPTHCAGEPSAPGRLRPPYVVSLITRRPRPCEHRAMGLQVRGVGRRRACRFVQVRSRLCVQFVRSCSRSSAVVRGCSTREELAPPRRERRLLLFRGPKSRLAPQHLLAADPEQQELHADAGELALQVPDSLLQLRHPITLAGRSWMTSAFVSSIARFTA